MNFVSNVATFFDSTLDSLFGQMPFWIGWLVYLSLIASVVAVLACVFQKLAGRRISARLIYVIWILVCLRFVLVATPESPTSFLNLIQQPASPVETSPIEIESDATQTVVQLQTSNIEFETELPGTPLENFVHSTEEPVSSVSIEPTFYYVKYFWISIATVWILVVSFLLLKLLAQAIGIAKLIRNSQPAAANEIFANKILRTHSPHDPNPFLKPRLLKKVRISDDLDVPATVGLFRPIVLLPRWCAAELSTKQLEVVLVHEFVHIQRYDVLIQLVSHLVMTFHWFNPVARYVRNRIEEFREITCDQRVIQTCGLASSGGTRLYAETILLFVDRASNLNRSTKHPEWIPGFVGGNKNFIRERILMMDQKKSGLAKVVGLAGMVLLVLVGFTSAQTPEKKSPAPDSGNESLNSTGVTIQLPHFPSTQKHRVVSVSDGGTVLICGRAHRADLIDSSVDLDLPLIAKPTKSTTVSVPDGGLVRHSRAHLQNRRVVVNSSPNPVKFTPSKITIDGRYGNGKLIASLNHDQAAVYELEVYQGKKPAMNKLIDQIIHPDSVVRAARVYGEIPRVGVLGLDSSSWGLGTDDADQKLATLLADPKNGFRKVAKTTTNEMSSAESVQIISEEYKKFVGKQFKRGTESPFSYNFQVGTSVHVTPVLKGTKLCSVVKIENDSVSSILRKQFLSGRLENINGEWKEHPHFRNTKILQAVTVPAASRYMVWATGPGQDSSAKKLAEDDALIVLVKPKLIPRKIPQKIASQEKSIPTFVEGKLKLPSDPAIAVAGSKVVAASHSAEALTPAELAKRLEAKAVAFDVQLYQVATKELNWLFEANTTRTSNVASTSTAQPISGLAGQALSTIGAERQSEIGYGGQVIQLGKHDSKKRIEFTKQLAQLAKKSKAILLSNPKNALAEKDKPSVIRVGQSFPYEKGRIENGILIKEGVENIQLGHEVQLAYRIHPKTGKLVTSLISKLTDVSPDGDILLSIDSKGNYVKRPGILETEFNTTLLIKPGNTVAQMAGTVDRKRQGEYWTTLLLITPRIITNSTK